MNVTVFGHRGAAGEAPENTMAGFRYAYDKAGVRNFELDIRLTRDGRLAVIHDPALERTTNGRGRVGDRTLEELKRLDARGAFLRFERAEVPCLEEVLEAFGAKVGFFQLEIKSDRPEIMEAVSRKLLESLNAFELKSRVTVTSFDPRALEMVGRLEAGVRRGLISFDYTEAVLGQAVELGCRNACIPLRSGSRELVDKAHRAGLEVTAWLGNSEAEVAAFLEWKADSITTDFPALILPILKARGVLEDIPGRGR